MRCGCWPAMPVGGIETCCSVFLEGCARRKSLDVELRKKDELAERYE